MVTNFTIFSVQLSEFRVQFIIFRIHHCSTNHLFWPWPLNPDPWIPFLLQYVFHLRLRPSEDLPVPYTTQKPSIISTGLLKPLLTFHLRPIQQVVSLRSYTFQSRELILKRVSHLDAFSGYLFRTWLLSCAPGGTTDTPEVRPPRSSRTRGSPSQFSFAHSG